jgi:saccharopine dehydrogenase (NAD+, L-lysine-forming)
MGVRVTRWDIEETRDGGPFPEILLHDVFLNCILAQPGCPVFVPAEAIRPARQLTVIGDIACDPTSDFSPIKVYDRTTDWDHPALRVAEHPPLDVMAIDNLPSMLPRESSSDYAEQLLPVLRSLDRIGEGAWGRAAATYDTHLKGLSE